MATDFRLKESLPDLTDRIVETYFKLGTIDYLGHCPLPSYETTISATEDLKEILYPGYRRRDGLHASNVSYHVGTLVDRLHDKLTLQFARSLCHGAGKNTSCNAKQRSDFEALGQSKAVAFLDQLPELRETLAMDVEAAFAGDPACKSLDEVIFCYPGLEAVTVYRLAHLLHGLKIPLIPRMMTEWAHGRTGIDIHPGAKIGNHFFIDHGTGVVVGETCIIGDRVKLYHGVTLAAFSNKAGRADSGKRRHPTIQDDVTIYPNATILGGDTVIGEGSVIGGNVWLTESVPRYTRVTVEEPTLQLQQKRSPEMGEGI